MDEQNTPAAPAPIYQESQEKSAKWLWLLIFLIIIGALAFAFFRGLGPFENLSPFIKGKISSPTPSPVSISSPQSEASPTTDVDKAAADIRVLNGSGIAGKASAVKDFLEGLGWTVASIGNADNYEFENTQIRFKEGFEKYESVLKEDMSSDYSVATSDDPLESSDSADIEITVGTK